MGHAAQEFPRAFAIYAGIMLILPGRRDFPGDVLVGIALIYFGAVSLAPWIWRKIGPFLGFHEPSISEKVAAQTRHFSFQWTVEETYRHRMAEAARLEREGYRAHEAGSETESENESEVLWDDDLKRNLAVLDLVPPCSFNDVRAAYKRLVRSTHPDLIPLDAGFARRAEAEREMQRLNGAHDWLQEHWPGKLD